jgi:signal transduction histidine kinase
MIYGVTFYFYRLPIEAVLYAAELCLVLALLLLIPDYLHYRRKHILLQEMKKNITVNPASFSETRDLIEEDYQELLHILYEEKSGLETQAAENKLEMVDYYTMWAHQIKTPISAMRLLLQSVGENNLTELQPDLTGELFRIEQYTEMALTFLRMESMSSDLLLKRYSLDGIIKQAVHKFASYFVYRKISLNYSELNTDILTDEKWISFVLEQILSNALKYTGEGGSISIYMDLTAPKTLVIEDTGIGIEKEDLPRVFEKGFTGYNGRMDKRSTGIGLYLCKRILKKLSHTIQIESEVGKGTKVKIGFEMADRKDI